MLELKIVVSEHHVLVNSSIEPRIWAILVSLKARLILLQSHRGFLMCRVQSAECRGDLLPKAQCPKAKEKDGLRIIDLDLVPYLRLLVTGCLFLVYTRYKL